MATAEQGKVHNEQQLAELAAQYRGIVILERGSPNQIREIVPSEFLKFYLKKRNGEIQQIMLGSHQAFINGLCARRTIWESGERRVVEFHYLKSGELLARAAIVNLSDRPDDLVEKCVFQNVWCCASSGHIVPNGMVISEQIAAIPVFPVTRIREGGVIVAPLSFLLIEKYRKPIDQFFAMRGNDYFKPTNS